MMADVGAEAEAKTANKLPGGEAVGDELKDDTPGVSGEVMLVNTDSFEECNHDLDTQFSGGEDGPDSPIRKVQQGQVRALPHNTWLSDIICLHS